MNDPIIKKTFNYVDEQNAATLLDLRISEFNELVEQNNIPAYDHPFSSTSVLYRISDLENYIPFSEVPVKITAHVFDELDLSTRYPDSPLVPVKKIEE